MTATLALVFDSGMLVLIWMVQCIIYPSFQYHDFDALKKWHARYTKKIGLTVVPLMFGQLGMGIYGLMNSGSVLSAIKIILIAYVWLITFALFVPLHSAMDGAKPTETPMLIHKLVQKNRSRTIVWTLIFLIGLWQAVIPYRS